ncbi:amidohydrolase family protein [Microbacterium thalassium]|uniref:Aminocarboxymuconate-semialdehyde decarboxylase n=1 Tax=Microbacterium thalassium TaxID=362649 RepID=A0A7X0FN61_9MICO|nr:amidohydrolase family protein [Microbacterium thalassium]MBB6390531.1 aminocarboxymuconate-semialdehyde decarboxylase [Microbacterium thalassium]GLK25642.1 amidohydrolase [Microbacterium thalassium]
MTTDVHAHLLMPGLHAEVERRAPEAVAEAAALELRRNGAASQAVSGPMVGSRIPKLTDVTVRLEEMDRQGVDRQWVSASPNHFYPWAPEDLAAWMAAEANRLIAAHVAQAPARLLGLGVVPLQHPHRIVEALEDAVLGHGLIGVEISSFAGDVELSDVRLEPFWSRAEELGAIIFLHPFGCSLDERLDRYYLANTVGQPVENAVALSHLIFSGVLDRHPTLKIVAAHGGGYLPTAIGRSDHAWRVRPDAQRCAHAPSSYLRRIWFDTVVHDATALNHLVGAAGGSQVVLGSDYPFDMGLDDPVAFVRSAGLPSVVVEAILAGNADALVQATVEAASL